MNLKRPFSWAFFDILLALHGSIVISFVIPWSEVFSTSLASGGDNPAHPVLMKSIGNAFFEHFSVVHYSWDFWSGFEAFQFYFPLPYLSGAILGRIIGDNIAFKLTTLFGLLAFPPALYIMTRLLGMTRVAGACASILAVGFLFTDAHVMWGGNVSSTLAGMIGNSWSFVFLVVAIGGLYRARIENKFSLFTLLCCIAAALCHFYAFLMLLMMSAIFMAEDSIAVFRKKFQLSNSYVFYLTLICFGLCLAWWFMPLFAYRRWSTDFGGTWDVKLLETLILNEKWIFASAFLISIGACLYFRKGSAHIIRFFAFLIIFLCLFFVGEKFNSTITVNIRLWPSIYLSLFLITIATFDFISKRIPLPLSILLLAFTLLLIPSQSAFDKAHSWMQWNYSGVEAKPGAGDFWRIVKILSTEPKSKVSFESSPPNNTFIGSIRSLEVLPAFTGQTLVEGGIVNSATFPGIGYSLQCLMSHSCAGWPNGSSMPHHDVERGIDTMKALGVNYHIAQNQEIINEILNTNKMELLYKGRFLSLFKLKETAPLVTVYDSPLPVIKTKRPHSLLLNMGRFDALRHAGVIFDSDWVKASDSDGKILDPIDLLNFMTKEWYADKRAKDMGWDSRDSKLPNRYLNGFFFAWKRNFDIDDALDHDLTYLLSERSYSPELLVSNMQKEGSESGAVLTRYSSGIAPISISGRGYKVLLEDKELPLNATSDIEFKEKDFRGRKGTFVVLRFVPIPGEKYQDVDIVTSDAEVFPGFPGGSTFHPMQPSMAACDAQLRREFNKLILDTKCPNKPHLIKYSYYPKWQADVPISMGPNGFMVLTPKTERTEILHRWRNIDIVACIITCVGLLMVLVLILKPRVY